MKRKMSMRDAYAEKWRKNGYRSKNPHRPIERKSKPPKPRKALKKVSTHRAQEMDAYYGQRTIFLQRYPVCVACLTRDISPAPSAQVHHLRGRQGRLLRDERLWIAVCAPCHDWIHTNPRAARQIGLLASATEFNTMPKP